MKAIEELLTSDFEAKLMQEAMIDVALLGMDATAFPMYERLHNAHGELLCAARDSYEVGEFFLLRDDPGDIHFELAYQEERRAFHCVIRLIPILNAKASLNGSRRSVHNDSLSAKDVRTMQLAGDDNAPKIFQIAQNQNMSADQRLRLISKIDSRYYGKKSSDLAELLGVTPNAIRQTGWWKTEHLRHHQPD